MNSLSEKPESGRYSEFPYEVYEYNIDFKLLDVSVDQIIHGLGYTRENPPAEFTEEISRILQKCSAMAEIKGGFVILPQEVVLISREKIRIGGTEFFSKMIITKRLLKSLSLALFTVTAGGEIEKWSKKIMDEGEFLKGYLADAAASEITERAADWLEIQLEKKIISRGWKITNRYSPGYCGWDVGEQQKLFSFLPSNFCGIRLTESSLMIPVKSVSGIIGLGPHVKREDYECSLCDLKNCFRRKDI